VPRETAAGERRVALVPAVVGRLKAAGLDVVVETEAGLGALIPDALYEQAGARLGDPWSADVVVKVTPPTPDEIGKLRSGAVLIGFLAPLTSPDTITALRSAGVTGFAMESIPRISRAQSMDALSSQANVAGYKAALLGAEEMGRFYPMLMTAAGTIPPAKVLVLGVGVAGLQALATAKRLGARTTGYDVRPEVAEQVQSLGAQWLDLGLEASGEGGYARELTDEERARQQQALTDAIKGFDVVILLHGDLLTKERLDSIQASRKIEDTLKRRFQHLIFLPGLFHYKMACADAFWRTWVQPKEGCSDINSLFEHVGVLRPDDTGKFGSSRGFDGYMM